MILAESRLPPRSGSLREVTLSPVAAWRELIRLDGQIVWITESSYTEISVNEPSIKPSSCTQPSELIRLLKDSDLATFVHICEHEGTVAVECRPRSSDRIYISRSQEVLEISYGIDALARTSRQFTLSKRFFALWLANAVRFGNFDFFLGQSPFDGVQLIARGFSATIHTLLNTINVKPIDGKHRVDSAETHVPTAIALCRNALFDAVASAGRSDTRVLAECSGGIDSGLVAAIARKVVKQFAGGIYVDVPHPEFSLERRHALAVADFGDFPLLEADYATWRPWESVCGNLPRRPSLEPSLHIPYFGQVLAAFEADRTKEPKAILTGQGGDFLFQTRTLSYSPVEPVEWATGDLWHETLTEMERIADWVSSPIRVADAYGLDNPWLNREMQRMDSRSSYYSPLSSRSVVACFANLRALLGNQIEDLAKTEPIVQKPLAHLVFSDLLPDSVWQRRWKVNFVGLQYRWWIKNGDYAVSLLKTMVDVLIHLGTQPRRVLARVSMMANGQNCADRATNALVLYLHWLNRLRHDASGNHPNKLRIPLPLPSAA